MTAYSDTAPLMMNQGDIEMEMPVVNRQPAPVMMKQGDAEMGMPVVNMQPAPVTIESDNITSADLRAIHDKGDISLVLAIVSFICCFFSTMCVYSVSMLCHIPAMLLAAKSRVSAEKKDYYESKLMLHWSYICTFAGCFIGGVLLFGATLTVITMVSIALSLNRQHNY